MKRFLVTTIANMSGLAVATWLLSGLHVVSGTGWSTTLLNYGLVAMILTLLNMFVRPVIKFLSFPLYILTFGLFFLVVNAIIITLAGAMSSTLIVTSFWTAICAGAIISVIASAVTAILPKHG